MRSHTDVHGVTHLVAGDAWLSPTQAAALGQLMASLVRGESEQELHQTIVTLLPQVIPAQRVSLTLLTDGGDELEVMALQGACGSLATGARLPLQGSALGMAVRGKRLYRWSPDSDSSHPEGRALAAQGIRAVMNGPIIVGTMVIGTINVAAAREFSTNEEHLLCQMTQVLARNLERIHAISLARLSWDEQVFAVLAERERRIAHLVDDCPLLLLVVDADCRITQVSRFGASRLGFDANELRGQPLATLYPTWSGPEVLERVRQLMDQRPDDVQAWQAAMCDAGGRHLWVRHTARRLGTEPPELLIVCEDVTEVRQLADRLQRESAQDALTGLANRREFERRLGDLAARVRAEVAQGSLCHLDLDHFKLVNDLGGHAAGDLLLRRVAETLRSVVSTRDVVARLGGDEFAVLLEGCTLPDALKVGERLRRAVRDLVFSWQGQTYPVSVSVGVATIGAEETDGHLALRDADDACYLAKGAGRDVVSSAHECDTARRRDREWVARVRTALQGQGLRLAGQTILPLRGTSELARFETLVRLQDGDELVPAGVFIPASERVGLITEIDLWVVDELIRELHDVPRVLERIEFCTMNLSARSVESTNFLESLLERLRLVPQLCPKLVFELTETSALTGYSAASRFVESISALGCRFALDDFGAGFSTFQHLRHLPLSFIKIDGALVRGLGRDAIDAAILGSITHVARAAQLTTIAEFVQDSTVASSLRDLGVDFGQGYGLGRPEPLSSFLANVRA